MDQERFDQLARLLGTSGTRRAGLKAAFGGLLGVGAATAAATEAPARRRRKCDPPCAAGQTCRKGACACDNGGTVCGAGCCLIGQRCEGGRCVELPEPGSCIAFGEPCKNAGRRCCENLQCGSGQGGSDVACYVRKTGRCTSTAECIYGTECVDGVCIAPVPPPPGPTCVVEQCPTCTGGGVPEAAAERVCNPDTDSCGCICLRVQGEGWDGVSCSVSSTCEYGGCTDISTGGECQAGSRFCCCQLG